MIFTSHTYPCRYLPNKMYNYKQKNLEITELKNKTNEEVKKEQCPPQFFLKKIWLNKHNTLCIKDEPRLTMFKLDILKPLKKKKSNGTQVCL